MLKLHSVYTIIALFVLSVVSVLATEQEDEVRTEQTAKQQDATAKDSAADATLTGAANLAVEDKLKQQIAQRFPGVVVQSIKPTNIAGLYEVVIRGQGLYITADAKYAIQGELFDLSLSQNLTEETRRELRRELLATVPDKNTVVYAPTGKVKHTITVFTDTSCLYCRKLHEEVKQLNSAGVKVRYLLYPRAGMGSNAAQVLQSVWCADNPQQAMDKAKKGLDIEPKRCPNPIEQHIQLAQQFGLEGTPMIVTDTGHVIAGYRPARELLRLLEEDSDSLAPGDSTAAADTLNQ